MALIAPVGSIVPIVSIVFIVAIGSIDTIGAYASIVTMPALKAPYRFFSSNSIG